MLNDKPDEFGVVGNAYMFNDAGELIQTLPAGQVQRAIEKLSKITEVSPSSVDDLLNYYDESDQDEPLGRFLMNLEGYNTEVYQVDHGDAGIAEETLVVVIVVG